MAPFDNAHNTHTPVDDAPTLNSSNLVTSGGVATVLATKQSQLIFTNNLDNPSGVGRITPNIETGTVTYTPPDLSNYLTAVPDLAASKITSGRFGEARMPAKRLFQAYTSGTQSTPNGTKITTWNTSNSRHIDTERALNSSHGLVSNQYIISTAGYWRIQSHVVFQNSPGNSAHLNSYLRVNNAYLTNPVFNMCQLTDATHDPDQQGVTVSVILNLSVGNSVDVFITQFTATPLANVTNAMFECEYLGPA